MEILKDSCVSCLGLIITECLCHCCSISDTEQRTRFLDVNVTRRQSTVALPHSESTCMACLQVLGSSDPKLCCSHPISRV